MHERARQGRLRAQFMKEIRSLKEKGKPERGKAETGFLAAMKIQKMWRGYASRTQTRKKKHEEMILIGMLPDPKQDSKIQENIESIRRQRHKTQSEYYHLYLDSLKRFEDEIKNKQGAPMTEDMADEIRNWFKDYFTRTGELNLTPASVIPPDTITPTISLEQENSPTFRLKRPAAQCTYWVVKVKNHLFK